MHIRNNQEVPDDMKQEVEEKMAAQKAGNNASSASSAAERKGSSVSRSGSRSGSKSPKQNSPKQSPTSPKHNSPKHNSPKPNSPAKENDQKVAETMANPFAQSAGGGLFGAAATTAPPGLFSKESDNANAGGNNAGGLFSGAVGNVFGGTNSVFGGKNETSSASSTNEQGNSTNTNSGSTNTATTDPKPQLAPAAPSAPTGPDNRSDFVKNAEKTATAERISKTAYEVVENEEVTTIAGWEAKTKLHQIQNYSSSVDDNETEFAVHRLKLFRMRNNEWKERAVGDAQLLKTVGFAKDGSGKPVVEARFLIR
jgi:hypothetical protein